MTWGLLVLAFCLLGAGMWIESGLTNLGECIEAGLGEIARAVELEDDED